MKQRMIWLTAGLFLAGCATTQQPSLVNQLQRRVGELELEAARKADEIDSLKREVDHLNDKLARLSRQASSSRPVTSPVDDPSSLPTVDVENVIRVDVSGAVVQSALKKAGFYDGKIDGKVGPQTQKAIRAFQEKEGIKADGIVGKATWERLKAYQ